MISRLGTITLSFVLASALIACGGGSGGSSQAALPPPPVVVSPPPYTLSPATVTASYVAGYPASVNLTARQTIAFTGIAYLKVVADADVIDPTVAISGQADGSFAVNMKTSA